jgi:hypothetical protein
MNDDRPANTHRTGAAVKKINGLTYLQYSDFYLDLWMAPCIREAVDAVNLKWFGTSGSTPYPDEYYADKDNRMLGVPTGHLRCLVSQGGKMVWVKHDTPKKRVENNQ